MMFGHLISFWEEGQTENISAPLVSFNLNWVKACILDDIVKSLTTVSRSLFFPKMAFKIVTKVPDAMVRCVCMSFCLSEALECVCVKFLLKFAVKYLCLKNKMYLLDN